MDTPLLRNREGNNAGVGAGSGGVLYPEELIPPFPIRDLPTLGVTES